MRISFVIFLLIISAGLIQSQSIRKGPYLIYTGNISEMKILWQLDTTEQCTLKWGIDSLNLSNTIISDETGNGVNEHQHFYLFSGLNPNLKYFYKLIVNNDTVSSYFRSAQDNSDSETVFYAYGDTRTYPANQDSVCNTLLADLSNDFNSQTFLLHVGDWTSDDSETNWDNEFFNRNYSNNIELQSKIPLMGCRGNHESSALQYNKYWPYEYNYSGDYYSFDYGLVHISFVDLYTDFTSGSEQLTWLQNDLLNTDKTWKFVVLHEPAYTDTISHKNNIDVQNLIVPVCKQNNVKVIFGGHNHYYAHCLVDSIHHLTIGGGAAPLYTVSGVSPGLLLSEKTLHYVKIRTTTTQAVFDIIRPDNSLVESFVINAPVSVKDIEPNNEYDVYYFDDILNINQINTDEIFVEIYNYIGQCVYNNYFIDKENRINLSKLTRGVYFVRINNSKEYFTKKVIVN